MDIFNESPVERNMGDVRVIQFALDSAHYAAVPMVDGGNLDRLQNCTVSEAAALQKSLQDILEKADELKKVLQKAYDISRFTRLPNIMEREDMEGGKIAGVGTIVLQSDVNVSIRAGAKEDAFEWLEDNGLGDIIQPAVNSSTLKATIKGEIRNGKVVPENLFNVSTFTRASIRK